MAASEDPLLSYSASRKSFRSGKSRKKSIFSGPATLSPTPEDETTGGGDHPDSILTDPNPPKKSNNPRKKPSIFGGSSPFGGGSDQDVESGAAAAAVLPSDFGAGISGMFKKRRIRR